MVRLRVRVRFRVSSALSLSVASCLPAVVIVDKQFGSGNSDKQSLAPIFKLRSVGMETACGSITGSSRQE